LEEIKRNVEIRSTLSYQNRPAISFDEIPTLANRQNFFDAKNSNDAIKELNEILPTNTATSLNDILKTQTKEINHALNDAPIKELNEIFAAKNTNSLHEAQSTLENIKVEKKEPNIADENFMPAPKSHTNTDEKNTSVAKELNEILPTNNTTSINDLHNKPVNEVSDVFEDAPIKDLKKAIGINERFLYLNELFRGDEDMYERSIKTINSFTIYPEAEFWIRRELKLKLGWDDKYNTVKQFDQLIRRRFS
jgi:hypothetical protein